MTTKTRLEAIKGMIQEVQTTNSPLLPFKRRTLNAQGLLLAWLCPWVVFTVVLVLDVSPVRYHMPEVVSHGVLVVMLFCALPLLVAWRDRQLSSQPSWAWYVAISIAAAAGAAYMTGGYVFGTYLQPYYTLTNLNQYPKPPYNAISGESATQAGQLFTDAGVILFEPGSYVDRKRMMLFENIENYCVAPIVSANQTQDIDFWAVGKECCEDAALGFACGDVRDPVARSGLRQMNQVDMRFYQMAVQQAEAKYNVTSQRPLFFEWQFDAAQTLADWKTNGWVVVLQASILVGALTFMIPLGLGLAFARVGFLPLTLK
eukprot:CAMPEP_0204276548 /NCGR_PEP_ID=MMETSP0468-20130131/28327_1 /ASSEMBLY_ACC=CAM_ASM_000383 /TAXON_ID=2969 /ORGANISM="Oxyrrhis marina" /LENGTH=315 /DNA_ID=CAMNT_0051253181 /DNA_START=7 /DNA_END=954 /DNA_ORIENTATION=+